MPAPQSITTIDQLLALPADGLRHELLDGEHVMTPAPLPRHQRVVGALWEHLRVQVRDHQNLEVLGAPADIRLSPNTLVQPDLFIVESDPANRFEDWADAPVPLIAIEVLSPSTALHDRTTKRRLYLKAGVEEYWIVDVQAKIIEQWRRGDKRPEIAERRLEWKLRGGASGSLDLGSLFGCIGD